MGRRPLAGRDKKIIQGHRRDEFFARMRRKGGVPRMPSQGAAIPEPLDETEAVAVEEAEPAIATKQESEPAEAEEAVEATASAEQE
jgi:hypothetical protein